MPHIELIQMVNAPADAVFRFASDPANLTRLVPGAEEAMPEDGSVRLRGHRDGHVYEQGLALETDERSHKISFRSQQSEEINGWLLCRPGDTTQSLCEVTAHLGLPEQIMNQDPDRIEDEVRDALDRLRHEVESAGGTEGQAYAY